MNKGLKIAVAIVLGVWIFLMGFEIGKFLETKKTLVQQPTSVELPSTTMPTPIQQPTETQAMPTQASTDAPTQQQPQSEEPQPEAPQDSTSQAPTEAEPSGEMTNEEILAAVQKAVNDTKHYAGSFTAVNVQNKDLGIEDCSVKNLTSTVDKIVRNAIAGSKEDTFTFNNGNGTNQKGESIMLMDAVPPDGKDFFLDMSGLSSASYKKEGDNTIYTLNLVAEKADLTNPPTHNITVAGCLDLSDISIVKQADIDYSGTTVEATVDANGRLVAYHVYMPIRCVGTGAVGPAKGSATFSGALDETWTFTYA